MSQQHDDSTASQVHEHAVNTTPTTPQNAALARPAYIILHSKDTKKHTPLSTTTTATTATPTILKRPSQYLLGNYPGTNVDAEPEQYYMMDESVSGTYHDDAIRQHNVKTVHASTYTPQTKLYTTTSPSSSSHDRENQTLSYIQIMPSSSEARRQASHHASRHEGRSPHHNEIASSIPYADASPPNRHHRFDQSHTPDTQPHQQPINISTVHTAFPSVIHAKESIPISMPVTTPEQVRVRDRTSTIDQESAHKNVDSIHTHPSKLSTLSDNDDARTADINAPRLTPYRVRKSVVLDANAYHDE